MKKINLNLIFVFLAVLGFFLYSVSSILMPFVVSLVMAYFLNPLTNILTGKAFSRGAIVGLIVTGLVIIIGALFVKMVPALFEQIHQFIIIIPKYKAYVLQNILPIITEKFDQLDPNISVQIKEQLGNVSNKFFEYLLQIITSTINSSLAIINIIGFIVFIPILVFYLLRDWPKFVDSTDHLIPLVYKDLVLEQLSQIDLVLSAYVRGQISVCLILSSFYVVCLTVLGVNYSLLIGLIAGILIIIPYLGVIIGFIICSVVALMQFSDLYHVYATLAIFFTGHLLESYFVTPKLIGEKVGLHPVWVIFALMAGGALFGFWGIFFAIPMAAIIGVLLRCLLKIYFASTLYNDVNIKE